jgi:group I intron endonuclease
MLIYKVTNQVNGKVYIGQTSLTLDQRRKRHERDAARLDRKTVKFHNALLKYGFDKFTWEVLKTCQTQDELDNEEILQIKQFNATDRKAGYNLKTGGKLGGIYTEEAKASIGESTRKKWEDPEIAKRMREGLAKATEEWKRVCEEKRILRKCPICGKEDYLPVWEAKKYKYCSIECANIGEKDLRLEKLKLAASKNKEVYEEEKRQRLEKVKEWLKIEENKEKVNNSKTPEIYSSLSEFLNIKDHRTISKTLDSKNKAEALSKLKNLMKMYADQSDE